MQQLQCTLYNYSRDFLKLDYIALYSFNIDKIPLRKFQNSVLFLIIQATDLLNHILQVFISISGKMYFKRSMQMSMNA